MSAQVIVFPGPRPRKTQGAETAAADVWMQIQRFSSGPKRSFWRTLFPSFHKTQCATVAEVQQVADGYLVSWLTARRHTPEPMVVELRDQHSYYSPVIRRGLYRVTVSCPGWIEKQWLTGAGA